MIHGKLIISRIVRLQGQMFISVIPRKIRCQKFSQKYVCLQFNCQKFWYPLSTTKLLEHNRYQFLLPNCTIVCNYLSAVGPRVLISGSLYKHVLFLSYDRRMRFWAAKVCLKKEVSAIDFESLLLSIKNCVRISNLLIEIFENHRII